MNDNLNEIVARGIWATHPLRGDKWELELDIIKVECWEQAADALATRQTTEDDETLRDEFRSYLGDEVYVCSRDHSAWSHGTMGLDDFSLAAEDDGITESLVQIAKSRAAVPDAATEAVWKEGYDLHTAELVKIAAERDAALAAVERCRVAVEKHKHWNDDCGWDVPAIELLAALDGAPEPEWEYRVEYRVPGGKTHVSGPMDSLEEARGFVLENIHGGAIVRRAKEVSAGPWLPVEGEKP